MLDIHQGRRTQVVKGEVCKTSMQRFESARRLQLSPSAPTDTCPQRFRHTNSDRLEPAEKSVIRAFFLVLPWRPSSNTLLTTATS